MLAYRLLPAPALPDPPKPPRSRAPMVIAISALMHVAVLGASALMQPKAPPPPRVVDVMQWEAVQLDNGDIGWRTDGMRKARVRGEAST